MKDSLQLSKEDIAILKRSAKDGYNDADYAYQIIMEQLKKFEEDLDDNEELAISLTSFGQNKLMYVYDLHYANPSLLFFYGIIDGKDAQIIQHLTQLNFLITSAPKLNKDKPHIELASNHKIIKYFYYIFLH